MDPLQLRFNLGTIHCADEGDGPGNAEPYLWTVFFKIDGDTTAIKPVNGILHLQGQATVVGTPGNHGNLGVQEVDAGQTVSIPKAIGHFETTLTPIPIAGTSLSVAGVAGVLAILMEADASPDDAIAAGHAALNKSLADNLNKLIPTMGLDKQTVTDQDVKALPPGRSPRMSMSSTQSAPASPATARTIRSAPPSSSSRTRSSSNRSAHRSP